MERSAAKARLDALVSAHQLPSAFSEQVATVLELLSGEEASITAVRDLEPALATHVVDALDGLQVPSLREAGEIADIGSGAGFPGLVLAAALPAARVMLIESVGRKCAFMDRAAALAGLDRVTVVNARAEDWREGLGSCDAVTARAVAPLGVLVEYAAPLLRAGGVLVAWKGQRDHAEEADGEAAAAATGMGFAEVLRIEPRPEAEHRHLHVFTKISQTPAMYPRRAGMARKRPIHATS